MVPPFAPAAVPDVVVLPLLLFDEPPQPAAANATTTPVITKRIAERFT
jgi:hypothetical protein